MSILHNKMLVCFLTSTIIFELVGLGINKVGASTNLEKGVSLDISRTHYSLTSIKKIVDQIKLYGGDHIVIHFSDNERYAIASDKLKQTSMKTNSKYLTKLEVKTLISYANSKGIKVIPDFDIPGHSKGWLTKLSQVSPLEYKDSVTDFDNSTVDYFDLKLQTSVKTMLDEVLTLFQGQGKIVVGGDEVPGSKQFPKEFSTYMNNVAEYVESKGFVAQMWNDSLNESSLENLKSSIDILYWKQSYGGVTVNDVINKGNNIYNLNDYSLYFMPNSKFKDILGQQSYVKTHTPYQFHESSGIFNDYNSNYIKGSRLAFWGELSTGMTESQKLKQVLPLVQAYSQTY